MKIQVGKAIPLEISNNGTEFQATVIPVDVRVEVGVAENLITEPGWTYNRRSLRIVVTFIACSPVNQEDLTKTILALNKRRIELE